MRLKRHSNNNVDECRILGGIDTLYTFVDTSSSEALYQKIWDLVKLNNWNKDKYEYLNFSGRKSGFIGAWYKHFDNKGISLFRIGFKDPKKQKQVKNIQIQLYGAGIYSYGFKNLIEYVKIEISSLLMVDLSYDDFIPSRVDLNAFIDGYDFGSLSPEMFKTRFSFSKNINDEIIYEDEKSYEYHKYRTLQTLYFGTASSPVSFKIYDKLAEIDTNDDVLSSSIKRAYLAFNGLCSDHIWNCEFKIKREVLKQYSINTFTDLMEKADNLFKDLMTRVVFLGYDIEKIQNYKISKSLNKLPPHKIWDKISNDYTFFSGTSDVERVYKRYKDTSKEKSIYIISREFKKQIDLNQEFTRREINNIYNTVIREKII